MYIFKFQHHLFHTKILIKKNIIYNEQGYEFFNQKFVINNKKIF